MKKYRKSIAYCTALYDKQSYCQEERMECFNEAAKEAARDGILLTSYLYTNNSKKSFHKEMVKLHKKRADFPYMVVDLGHIEYWTHFKSEGLGWMKVDEDGNKLQTESLNDIVDLRHMDIYRLMAHIFNIGIDCAVEHRMDYFGILSGDQLLPKEHPSVMTRFLEAHPDAGMASSVCYYDFSKKEIVRENGEKRTYQIPLIIFRPRPGETEEEMLQRKAWIFANLLPYPENDYTGLEYCEVDAVGTGGAVIPREVFTKLKFQEKVFDGEGEDIQYCLDLKSVLGKKVYIVPTCTICNRYPSGELY